MEKKTLEYYRDKINDIDDNFIRLFQERMEIAGEIAEYKKENGLSVLDNARERAKMADIQSKVDKKFETYATTLYSLLFELSRSYQQKQMDENNALLTSIENAIAASNSSAFPKSAMVACQGVDGSYSQIACDKMFGNANIMYFETFDKVFSAIEKGLCRYGVLPIENSTAGSVKDVYDLMAKHNFHIARSTRIKVDHTLFVKEGVSLSDVKEIFSHEQALTQCSDFLATLGKDVKITTWKYK